MGKQYEKRLLELCKKFFSSIAASEMFTIVFMNVLPTQYFVADSFATYGSKLQLHLGFTKLGRTVLFRICQKPVMMVRQMF